MKCPYCGGEIKGERCEYCGSRISFEMRKELEQLNKKGCPKCGSSNISFSREQEGETWDSHVGNAI
jgi:DNA-directed RNA polymerase subunit RPC12/RpoP